MRVAVTGGTGCLGRPLVEKLLGLGCEIKMLVLPHERHVQHFAESVRLICGNLNSKHAVRELTKDCEVVFHLAGKVHTIPSSKNDQDEFFRVNVDGTRDLVEVCSDKQVKRIIFFSTVAVYGKDGGFHGDEGIPCEPVTIYAKSKQLAEDIVLNSEKDGGPQGTVLRFPVVYGPYDKGNVLKLIKAIEGRRFFYFGDGHCLRSMISSVNAAEAAVKAACSSGAGGGAYCVTDGRDYRMTELVEAICCALCTEWRPGHLPMRIAERVGEIGDFFEKNIGMRFFINSKMIEKLSSSLTFSCEKARNLLGYEPVETLLDGIVREVAWLKSLR